MWYNRDMDKYDVLLTNCNIADVRNLRFFKADIGIRGGKIVAVGENLGDGMDCGGAYALPGFIDAHTHIESSLLSPVRFAEAVLPCGTTTVIADPHEIANVCGMSGIDYMIEQARASQMDIKIMMPSCVPASPAERSGAVLDAECVSRAMDRDDIFGLGEMMNFPAVLSCDSEVMSKIEAARRVGKPIDGHYPLGKGESLRAYIKAGITSDHESESPEEALEKIAGGMDIFIREGSAGKQLASLLPAVNKDNFRRFSLCTDDCNAADIIGIGHINAVVAKAIALGIPPLIAIAMATINPCVHYNLCGTGVIEVGACADILLVDNLNDISPFKVYKRGVLVARDGKMINASKPSVCDKVIDSVHMPPLTPDKLKSSGAAERIGIAVSAGSLVTDNVAASECDSKLCVCQRHSGKGDVGVCRLKGYGVKGGAVALTVSHDSHNVVCAGDNESDMCIAVNTLRSCGGGMCAVSGGEVGALLELPVAGLMSDLSAEIVAEKLKFLNRFCREKLNINPKLEPVMSLSFLALTVIPHIKLTDRGLFDADKFRFIE